MGFRQAVVLAPTCFFLGVLFICANVDYRVLWPANGALADETIADAFQFYETFFNAPPAIKALLHAMVGVLMSGLFAKLYAWDDSAMFFDGSCIGIVVFGLAVYTAVVVPSLRTISAPTITDTKADQVEAIRLLSAGNIIIAGCMVLILALQAGQEYAKRVDARELAKIMTEENQGGETKKTQ